jgi:glycosyltransferase involved in cell wall biosynthesis
VPVPATASLHDEPTQASVRARLRELTGGSLLSAGAAVSPRPPLVPAERRLPSGPLPSVAYLLPGLPPEGSGGSHSLVQEARGLRRLGAPARVCVPTDALATAAAVYGNDDELFVPYPCDSAIPGIADTASFGPLLHAIGDARIVVATEYPSVDLLLRLARARPHVVCAYYVQDYEPLFAAPQSSRADRALLSYRALPGLLLFAKTHWLRNLLDAVHGVDVAKVAPSLDRELFHAGGRSCSEADRVVRLAAMIRPRTPRRRPRATLRALALIARELGPRVQIATFGCDPPAFDELHEPAIPGLTHLGLLTRLQVATLMRRSDIFIDASAYQAFGRTGLEAMACGAVPVLPQLGGPHEYAEHDRNALLLAQDSPEQIAAAVLALADDPPRLARLRADGVRLAQRFSVPRAARSQLALFAAAAASRAAEVPR